MSNALEPRINPHILVFLAVIDVSFAAIFIRLLQDNFATPFLIIAFYRLFFTFLILTPIFLWMKGWKQLRVINRTTMFKIVGAGILLALHFGSWILSLENTSIASSIIIVNTGSLFAVIFAYLLLKEQVTRRHIVGIILAFAGVIFIALADWSQNSALLGDLLAFFSAITFGFYLLVGRQVRKQLELIPYVYLLYSTTMLCLAGMVGGFGFSFYPYSSVEFSLFIALAVVPTIFGHTLYNWALKYVDTAIIGVAILGEPIGSILLGFVILGEIPHYIVLIGGIFVLIGIYITFRGNRRKLTL